MGDGSQDNDAKLQVRLSSELKRVARVQAAAQDKHVSAYVRSLIEQDKQDSPVEEFLEEYE